MRHRKRGKKLNRDIKGRKALFRSLVVALALKGQIKTTEARAKAVRGLFEQLVGKVRGGEVYARRLVARFLPNMKAVKRIADDIAPRYKDRRGGLTRIVRLGRRRGDNSMMVRLELVDGGDDNKVKEQKKKIVGKKKQEKPGVD